MNLLELSLGRVRLCFEKVIAVVCGEVEQSLAQPEAERLKARLKLLIWEQKKTLDHRLEKIFHDSGHSENPEPPEPAR